MRRIAVMLLATAAGIAMASGNAHAADAGTPKNQPKQIQKHEVVTGESLSTIATDSHLESWRPLWDANTDLQNPDQINVGQQLVIPDGPTTERPLPAGYGEPTRAAVTTVSSSSIHHSARVVRGNAAGGDLLGRIRLRESGGNYAENTGNGYYGAYQFSAGTWRGVGGSGNPADASPAEQDMRAQMLYDRRGCSPWPSTCY